MYLKVKYKPNKNKPKTVGITNAICPFCDTKGIMKSNKILDIKDNLIFMENKYPVSTSSYATVIIEHNQCNLDISNYPKEHLYKLLDFSVKHWLLMEESNKYKSSLLCKNHGVNSGASIQHSHMQIINLYDIDYRELLQDSDFEGYIIEKNSKVEFNISSTPKSEPVEFNIIIDNLQFLNEMADKLQIAVHYILNYLNTDYQSFNLFFYQYKGKYICKIVSRTISQTLMIGYNLKFKIEEYQDYIDEINNIYYN